MNRFIQLKLRNHMPISINISHIISVEKGLDPDSCYIKTVRGDYVVFGEYEDVIREIRHEVSMSYVSMD